jgi:carbon storage regulator
MIVISRKQHEEIVIGDHIVITVIEIRGDKVRLGIQAPRNMSVHRSEIRELLNEREQTDAKNT